MKGKIKSMNIIQIVITEGFGGAAKLFGLGENSKIYRWDYASGSWADYKKKGEDEELTDEVDKHKQKP